MANRYDNEMATSNPSKKFKKAFLEKRGRKRITQYETPTIYFPSHEAIRTLNSVSHIWKVGDRYFKLAHKYYEDSRYWWVIAWYNKKPTEAHLKTGDIIYIPTPLDRAIEIYLGL